MRRTEEVQKAYAKMVTFEKDGTGAEKYVRLVLGQESVCGVCCSG